MGPLQTSKRAFVKVLLRIAALYRCVCNVNRDSTDVELNSAFRKVAVKCHPDKGGKAEHSKELNTARDDWKRAEKEAKAQSAKAAASGSDALAVREKGFRIHSSAVMLTYNGIKDIQHWEQFVQHCKDHLADWSVKFWCATLEENKGGKLHTHLMVQFTSQQDVLSKRFAFDGILPNAGPNNTPGGDLLGEGLCRKRLQQSIDRGMFYVWANKIGTVQHNGRPVVEGNYFPSWSDCKTTYMVQGRWCDQLWHQGKLNHDVYEEYVFSCRQGVLARKRNLDAVRNWEEERAERKEMEDVVKRIRTDRTVYQPFAKRPEAEAWLQVFLKDELRYPILIVLGQSHTGKTEWAKSLFSNVLELKIGSLSQFPDRMREFKRGKHDGIVLDDVRDLAFITDNQDKMQAKYDTRVEFASTPGGTCAFTKWLFAVPIVVTANFSTKNLQFLDSHDFLGKPANRVVVYF